MEDALKRLDNLTHEEAWIAIAQNLKATHAVGERLKGVADNVLDVGDAVKSIGARTANIDEGVQVVNEMVAVVVDGAQTIVSWPSKTD